MAELPQKEVLELAKLIYEAKKEDAWGNWQSEYRGKWPASPKALRTCFHNEEDSGVLFAVAQAKAVWAHLSSLRARQAVEGE